MKISKEVKVGILASVTILASVWGYKFLKGNNFLDNSINLFTEVSNANQITKSAPVFFRGAQIGVVAEIMFPQSSVSKIILKLNIKEPIAIPKTAEAVLFPNGVMGGTAVEIVFDTPCNGADCAKNNDYLRGRKVNMLTQMLGSPQEVKGYFDVAKTGVAEITDTLKAEFDNPNSEMAKTFRAMQATISNLQATTAGVNKLVNASTQTLSASLKNVESITANLQASNAQISQILKNLETTTANFKNVDFQKTANGANDAIADLRKTLQASEKTVADLNTLTAKLKQGEGTLGQLMTNDSLYNNLNSTLLQVNLLSQDFRLNPRRYVNLNPFKKYKPYVKPKDDPALKK